MFCNTIEIKQFIAFGSVLYVFFFHRKKVKNMYFYSKIACLA